MACSCTASNANQSNTAAINSTNTANVVIIQSSTTVDGTGAAAAGSTLSVSGNVTEARGTANLMLNSSISIGGASTSLADATGLIGNFHFNEPTGDMSVAASTDTRIALAGTAATGVRSNGSASLQSNSTLALARGNVAENVLSAEGASASAGTSPATVDSNGSPSLGSLNASFGLFNEQVQDAAINAESIGATYTINATSGTGNALNGASASVGSNAINATGFGNVPSIA